MSTCKPLYIRKSECWLALSRYVRYAHPYNNIWWTTTTEVLVVLIMRNAISLPLPLFSYNIHCWAEEAAFLVIIQKLLLLTSHINYMRFFSPTSKRDFFVYILLLSLLCTFHCQQFLEVMLICFQHQWRKLLVRSTSNSLYNLILLVQERKL